MFNSLLKALDAKAIRVIISDDVSPAETAWNMEAQILMPGSNIKQESDCDKVEKEVEANREEESDIRLVIKRTRTSSNSLSSPDQDNFLYCEKCQLKYEGDCPLHGPFVYIDKAETEEANTELCMTSTSSALQCNIEKIQQKMHSTGKPFVCDLCGAGFTKSNALLTHVRTHTGEKPYKCDICCAEFAIRGHLKRHNKTHTGERPHSCYVCGVKFALSGQLRDHVRTHTGEKPCKCKVCGVGFTSSSQLSSHKKIHTGEKPHKCDVCGKGFVRSEHLKAHKRTHTGEKPYKCDVCDLEFTQSGQLYVHKRKHLKDKPHKNDCVQ